MNTLCPTKDDDGADDEQPEHTRRCPCKSVKYDLCVVEEGVYGQELEEPKRKEEAADRQEQSVDLLQLDDDAVVEEESVGSKINLQLTFKKDLYILRDDDNKHEA